jgi:hypothetical protein
MRRNANSVPNTRSSTCSNGLETPFLVLRPTVRSYNPTPLHLDLILILRRRQPPPRPSHLQPPQHQTHHTSRAVASALPLPHFHQPSSSTMHCRDIGLIPANAQIRVLATLYRSLKTTKRPAVIARPPDLAYYGHTAGLHQAGNRNKFNPRAHNRRSVRCGSTRLHRWVRHPGRGVWGQALAWI